MRLPAAGVSAGLPSPPRANPPSVSIRRDTLDRAGEFTEPPRDEIVAYSLFQGDAAVSEREPASTVVL